ncbi:MAG TPA: hypothetical protein VI796_02660 [Candidatus Thermoplasmatota archaeon]|nr:hypothetical protein [Candidatus Thermoplasmatota archaeon]
MELTSGLTNGRIAPVFIVGLTLAFLSLLLAILHSFLWEHRSYYRYWELEAQSKAELTSNQKAKETFSGWASDERKRQPSLLKLKRMRYGALFLWVASAFCLFLVAAYRVL